MYIYISSLWGNKDTSPYVFDRRCALVVQSRRYIYIFARFVHYLHKFIHANVFYKTNTKIDLSLHYPNINMILF